VPFFGWVAGSYWLDIGSPAKYRQGQLDLLAGRVRTPLTLAGADPDGCAIAPGAHIAPDATVTAPCVIGTGTRLESGAQVGPNAVLGANCIVGAGAHIEGAILWDRVVVGPGAVLRDCIVGSNVTIGPNAHLGFTAVLESNTIVPPDTRT
jgi:NDP-sugar pyrophosphorylase family protein